MIGVASVETLEKRRENIGKKCWELASSGKDRNNLGIVGN